jgi:hypothetical protein
VVPDPRGIRTHPTLVHTINARMKTCHRTNPRTEGADRRATPRLPDRPLVEAWEQLTPGHANEQDGDRQAIVRLEGPHGRLSLGGKDAIDRPRVKPKRAQMLLRHVDVAWEQEPVHRRL